MTASNAGDVFDVKKIRRLVQLMKEHELSEVDLEQGDQRIRLRRGGDVVLQAASPVAQASPLPQVPVNPGGEKQTSEAGADSGDPNITVIKSPMVGTFYVASSPETGPFVKIGDHVGPDSTVCIIEAMKVFNEIPGEVSGKILAVLVENGDPVEYGQPLFKVDVSA
tara:strand:+ start:99 stop:596 length:498 start_codon:yes stop_codon:yes gene_type:complete